MIDKPSQCSHRRDFPREGSDDLIDGFVVYFYPQQYIMKYWAIRVVTVESGAPVFENDYGTWDVISPDDARHELAGTIRWDGCTDLDIGGQGESCRSHYCGLDDALGVARMLEAVYALAAEHIEKWDQELAE